MKTLRRRVAYWIWAITLSLVSASPALADRRVALIIGNANYEHADTLDNTVNDAKAIAGLLKGVGFDVVDVRLNVGVVDFKRAVRDFLDKTVDADIAVVYYSGHGMEVGGVELSHSSRRKNGEYHRRR